MNDVTTATARNQTLKAMTLKTYKAVFKRVHTYIRSFYGLGEYFFVDSEDIINRALEYIVHYLEAEGKLDTILVSEFEALLMTVTKWRTIDALRALARCPVVSSTDETIGYNDEGDEVGGEEVGPMATAAVRNWRLEDFSGDCSRYGTRRPCRPRKADVVEEVTRIVHACLDKKGVSRAKQDSLLAAFFTDLTSVERAIIYGLTSSNHVDVSKFRCLEILRDCGVEFAKSPVLVEAYPFLADETAGYLKAA